MEGESLTLQENVMGKWKNNISFKKDTEKVVLLTVKGLIQRFVKLKAEKNCAC